MTYNKLVPVAGLNYTPQNPQSFAFWPANFKGKGIVVEKPKCAH
jgi:hypothetical protein